LPARSPSISGNSEPAPAGLPDITAGSGGIALYASGVDSADPCYRGLTVRDSFRIVLRLLSLIAALSGGAPFVAVLDAQAPVTPVPGQQTPVPGQQTPAPGTPPAVPGVPPAPVPVTPAVLAPAVITSRIFTAPAGLLFNTVRPERVKDYELFLSHVKAALEKSTDPKVQAQAKGWKFFKSPDLGPNGVALYIFSIDPAVPDADYSLGPILAAVYTDPAELLEIWKLYTSSVTGGGYLTNLLPLELPPPTSTVPQGVPATTQPRPVPPDADPTRKPLQ
jgi:hypothetical protein